MPELPEVETVLQGLIPVFAGQPLRKVEVRGTGLRLPFPKNLAARLTGKTVLTLQRRAKYILATLSSGETLVLHLGMSGRLRIMPPEAVQTEKHDHVVFHTPNAVIAFNDPRRFGLLTLIAAERLVENPLFADLGPEPLSPRFSAASLKTALAGRRTSIKAALLDQSVVAGLGNIYVSETLFAAGVAPTRPAGTVVETAALVRAAKAVLRRAIHAGGTTLRDTRFRGADGALGYFQLQLNVYDREGEPCRRPGCRGVIRRIVQAGRSTFYCPQCQK